MHPVYLRFQPSFLNRAETELKCNTGIWENLGLAYYHIDSWYLVPFSSNIYCDNRYKVSLCYGYRITHWFSLFLQAGYTARKFLYEAGLQEETSCNSNAWQSEWGFQCILGGLNFCMKEMQSAADSLQKEVSQLLSIKHTYKVQKIYSVPRNCYSWRAYVRNLVKLPERESEHKTLYNMEITRRAIILSLYMTVRSI